MSGNINLLIFVGAIMFAVLGGVTLLAYIYSLNNIKSRTVGDGQHGTARWASKREIQKTYKHIPFTPDKWRRQAGKGKTPTVSRIVKKRLFRRKNQKEKPEEALPQGIVVECTGNTTAMIDTGDVHALMMVRPGVGKTAYWLYPCIESKKGIMDGIIVKYRPDLLEPPEPPADSKMQGGQDEQMTEQHELISTKPRDRDKNKGGGATVQTAPRSRRTQRPSAPKEPEVKSDGQT